MYNILSTATWIVKILRTSYTSWWFQPIWKIIVELNHFPQVGVKIKYVWNHQQVSHSFTLRTSLRNSPNICDIRRSRSGRPCFGMSRKAIFFSETNSPRPKRKPQHIFQASKFQVRTLCLNWWLNQPLRMKNMSKNGLIFPNFRGEKKKSLKPASSFREGIHFTSPFPHSSKGFRFPGSSGTSFVRGRPGSPFLVDPQKYTKW